MRKLGTILLVGAAASQIGSTDCGNVLRDSGFDLWCGDTLCAWTVERGDIARVPTWNEGDPGVQLVGSDVAISQLTPVTSNDGACIEFDLVSNVDDESDVELNFYVDDGTAIDHTERVPTSNWQPITFEVGIANVYSGIRFEITKSGSGTAVLANIGATVVANCSGIDPFVPGPAPLGAPCSIASDCASQICGTTLPAAPVPFTFANVCLGCDDDHPCSAGDVCGIGAPASPVRGVPVTCVPEHASVLGQACNGDAECASSFCTEGACSECGTSADCPNAETCTPDQNASTGATYIYVCGEQLGQPGDPCAENSDCASATCNGATAMQCSDGRACTTAADCPFGMGSDNGLQNGSCLPVGIQGGSCQ